MTSPTLFTPLKVGRYSLSHRVVMAPLTRRRAGHPGNVPTDLSVEYYSQRASHGGLIITEGSQIAPSAQGYPNTPGIHSPEQVAGWKKIVDAVHEKGGIIFLQLWHTGRISHSSFQPDGIRPAAPSAIAAAGTTLTSEWNQLPFETPRALSPSEIKGIITDYRLAAQHALEAGFDGVEVHGANGYLIEQFLHTRTNQRTDAWWPS